MWHLDKKHANLRPKKQGSYFGLCSGISSGKSLSWEEEEEDIESNHYHTHGFPTCRCTSPQCQQTAFKQKWLLEVFCMRFCMPQRQDFLSWHKLQNSPFKSGSSQSPSTKMRKCSLKRLDEFKRVINNKRGRVVRTANCFLYICI